MCAGLAAYIFTNSVQRSWRVSEALEYGLVGVNEGLISTEARPKIKEPHSLSWSHRFAYLHLLIAGGSIRGSEAVWSGKGRIQVWYGRIP